MSWRRGGRATCLLLALWVGACATANFDLPGAGDEAAYAAHAGPPPRHLHPSQREDFTVLTGALDVGRGDEQFVVEAGSTFSVEPGTPHLMSPSGEAEVTFTWRTSPALRTDSSSETTCSEICSSQNVRNFRRRN